jgi:hypothetical protein
MEYMYLYEYLGIAGFFIGVGLFGYLMVNLKQWNKNTRE